MLLGPQIVPSAACFQCKTCCRFPEQDSVLRPYFTDQEIQRAVARGIQASAFPDSGGSQIDVVPHPTDEGFLCPAFDPVTQHCRIYEFRPLDCQLYPFTLMWNEQRTAVCFGWDPLCPFLPGQPLRETPFSGEISPKSFIELPGQLVKQARTLAAHLESDEVVHALAAHPRLITPFQPEVIVLQPLNRLTAAFGASGNPEIRSC
jgi:Fe-S-cluster containining protein